MAVLAILLACTGVADLVASLSGKPTRNRRLVAGWLIGIALAAILCVSLGYQFPQVLLIGLAVAAMSGIWLSIRVSGMETPGKAAAALLFYGGCSSVAIAGVIWWPRPHERSLLARWFDDFPLTFGLADLGSFLLTAGVVIALVASGNAVVRLVLTLSSADLGAGNPVVLAGRFIGPMERLLIFGFAFAGEPTAAVLVASAKSLLRFPELASSSRRDHDWMEAYEQAENATLTEGQRSLSRPPTVSGLDLSEYVVTGSLCSWFVALAAAAVVWGLR